MLPIAACITGPTPEFIQYDQVKFPPGVIFWVDAVDAGLDKHFRSGSCHQNSKA